MNHRLGARVFLLPEGGEHHRGRPFGGGLAATMSGEFMHECADFRAGLLPVVAPNNSLPVPVHGPWHYGNYCGAGGMGTPINGVD
jgi:hypothetical protein